MHRPKPHLGYHEDKMFVRIIELPKQSRRFEYEISSKIYMASVNRSIREKRTKEANS